MIAILAPVLVVAMAIFTWWRAPIVFVALVFVVAGTFDGALILIAGPLCIAGAARYLATARSIEFDRRRYTETAAATLGVFIVGLLTAAMTLDRSMVGDGRGDGGSGRGGAQPPPGFTQTRDGEGLLTRFLRWLTGSGPEQPAANGTSDQPGGANPPPDSPNWWLLAGIVAFLIALIVAWLMYRRWKRRDGDGDRAWSIARMERLGRDVGRPREANEGALSFGSALSGHVKDPRLAEVGRVVSADVYESRAVEQTDVSSWLGAVEADPPERPTRNRATSFLWTIRSVVTRPFRR